MDDAEARNIDPNTAQIKSPSKRTCDRQVHLARMICDDAVAVTNTIAKSESREIAEKSIIGGVSFGLLTLNTHTSFHAQLVVLLINHLMI